MSIVEEPTANPDLAQAALAALLRAGLRATEDARRTNTNIQRERGQVLPFAE